jgi:hypothetical protein
MVFEQLIKTINKFFFIIYIFIQKMYAQMLWCEFHVRHYRTK